MTTKRGTNPYLEGPDWEDKLEVDSWRKYEQETKQRLLDLENALRKFVDPDPFGMGYMFYSEFNSVSIPMYKCRGCQGTAFFAHDIEHDDRCIVGDALKVLGEQ